MSGDNSVGVIGPIFDPSAQQVGLQDSQTAVGLPGAKLYQTFIWVDDIAQVIQNPALGPDGKKGYSSTKGFVETLQWST